MSSGDSIFVLRSFLAELHRLYEAEDYDALVERMENPKEARRLAGLIGDVDEYLTDKRRSSDSQYERDASALLRNERPVVHLSDGGYSRLTLSFDDPNLLWVDRGVSTPGVVDRWDRSRKAYAEGDIRSPQTPGGQDRKPQREQTPQQRVERKRDHERNKSRDNRDALRRYHTKYKRNRKMKQRREKYRENPERYERKAPRKYERPDKTAVAQRYAARPIPVDKAQLRKVAQGLVDAMVAEARKTGTGSSAAWEFRGLGSYNSRNGVTAQGPSVLIENPLVYGSGFVGKPLTIPVWGVTAKDTGTRSRVPSASYAIWDERNQWIEVRFNARLSGAKLEDSKTVGDVYSVLLHEVTHATEMVIDRALSEREANPDRPANNSHRPDYYDIPVEVRAFMQQVADEVETAVRSGVPFRQALKESRSWQRVSPRMNQKNLKKIMKGVYTYIEEQGLPVRTASRRIRKSFVLNRIYDHIHDREGIEEGSAHVISEWGSHEWLVSYLTYAGDVRKVLVGGYNTDDGVFLSVRPFRLRSAGDVMLYDQHNPANNEIKQPGLDVNYRAEGPTTYTTEPDEKKGIVPGGRMPNRQMDDAPPASSRVIPDSMKETLQQNYMKSAAATVPQILSNCGPKVTGRSGDVKYRRKRLSPSGMSTWTAQSVTDPGKQYTVKIKPIRKDKRFKAVAKMPVKVTCSCPFWRWQGPEHWAKVNGYLYGKPRGTASVPVIRDPKSKHWACKHVISVLQLVKNYRYASDEGSQWSYDGPIEALPDSGRVAIRHLMLTEGIPLHHFLSTGDPEER